LLYLDKTNTLKINKEGKAVSVITLPQLAYELLPTTSEEIMSLDKDLQDIYC
jgi:hypothetical protein